MEPKQQQNAPLQPAESSTVEVSNIAPSLDPPTRKVVTDFFAFCGNIETLSLIEGDPTTAYIKFSSPSAASTALLLDNAILNDRQISVQLAKEPIDEKTYSSVDKDVPQTSTENQTYSSKIASIIAKGYSIPADALKRAKEWDESHIGITTAVENAVENITEKAKEMAISIEQNYHIKEKVTSGAAYVKEQIVDAGTSLGQKMGLYHPDLSHPPPPPPVTNAQSETSETLKEQLKSNPIVQKQDEGTVELTSVGTTQQKHQVPKQGEENIQYKQ